MEAAYLRDRYDRTVGRRGDRAGERRVLVSRQVRAVSIKARLMALDVVASRPDLTFFATESERVAFCDDLTVDLSRQKPSGIAARNTILRVHPVPALGSKRLDAITNEAVQRLKHDLRSKSVKTVNNF